MMSSTAEGLVYTERGLAALGEDVESMFIRTTMLLNHMADLDALGLDEERAATAREALVVAERSGSIHACGVRVTTAVGLYERGAWDDALAELEAAGDGLPPIDRVRAAGIAALIAGRRGDLKRATALLESVTDVTLDGSWVEFAAPAHAARALVLEAGGEPGPAADVLAQWIDPSHSLWRHARAFVLPDLVRLALAAGDRNLARAGFAAAAADALADPLPRRIVVRQHCRAMLDADPAGLEEAADLYLRVNRPVPAAAACGEAAITYAHTGDPVSARRCYARAAALYESLGAEFDLRRIADALRPYGIRRTVVRRPDRGWEALTGTERRIAGLIAEGMSNPEIADSMYLSRRTVSTHVSHILAKLDARRRLQIVQEVRRYQTHQTERDGVPSEPDGSVPPYQGYGIS
jgi:DNA-binding CsgD family transcriptional regulator